MNLIDLTLEFRQERITGVQHLSTMIIISYIDNSNDNSNELSLISAAVGSSRVASVRIARLPPPQINSFKSNSSYQQSAVPCSCVNSD